MAKGLLKADGKGFRFVPGVPVNKYVSSDFGKLPLIHIKNVSQ